jgi:hypothetical protein
MSLDINKQSMVEASQKAKGFYSKYKLTIIGVLLITLFGVIFYRINYFSSLKPTATMIQDQLQATTRPRIDQNLVEKLEKLESENIQVQALFKEARDNPFKE